MRRLSAPFLNCFSVSSGVAVFISLLHSRPRKAIKLHAFPGYSYTAFIALVGILPAAFAKAVDSPLVKSMSDSPLGKSVSNSPSVFAATACPCHGAPDAAFCGDAVNGCNWTTRHRDGLSNCIHGHLYQCANDGKSSFDLGAKGDSCLQAAGLN
ncbi:hypothetical protein JB92DRAFT_2847043 [Gautieria morchelliformis]|nr:hypothetical protein JB92DRAFT_2847043 [Gautieria morchelliformis]